MVDPVPPKEIGLVLLEGMQRCRQFEEYLHRAVGKGELPGFVHLSVGQEAVAVGVCQNLRDDDWMVSTHRGHSHLLAKGMSMKSMMAELYGKATGASHGKGGSMHMADPSIGIMGSNGIVGAGMSLANGPALSAKVRKTDQVSVCFFGDGASNQGTFHEALNLAAIWDLPTIFVLENNLYGEACPVEYSHRLKEISTRANGYGMKGVTVDGMDVISVYDAAREAVDRARRGAGPTLLECMTYRYYGHYEGDPDNYRSKEEKATYKKRDPIELLAGTLQTATQVSAKDLDIIKERVSRELEDAVEFAKSSPLPLPADCLLDVFANQ